MMKSNVEDAAIKMREFANSDLGRHLKDANEAETRLLVIDRVLDILGWQPGEYNPEHRTLTLVVRS